MKPMTMAQKMRVISKLRDMGYKDEKSIAALSFEDLIIKHENISPTELRAIAEIRKAVKGNSLYSYLMEEIPEKYHVVKEADQDGFL